MSEDPTEIVGVLRSHLDEVYTTLDSLRGYLAAQDLASGYRELKPNVRPSRLTAMTERSLNHIAGYLQEEE